MKEKLGKDMRLTNQRKVILEELQAVTSHPTADELYEMVRKRLPRISLGTVYRNLEVLSTCGLILKIEVAGQQKRFDGDTSLHHHIRCIHCGRVGDVTLTRDLPDLNEGVDSNFIIVGHRLEFQGVCPHCQKNPNTPGMAH
ncbi:MAG TPA: transcriptional repressor [Desulfomicrobiaceae bacterium]|nr:transcriptional repressor [Desulfomicrobiaceae bacterium]